MLDDINAKILKERTARFNSKVEARVGDYVVMPDGSYERFSHKYSNGLQTSVGGSFYLNENGIAGFSGGLNPFIPNVNLILTEDLKNGEFWFFHHDIARAHSAVYVTIECRVWKVTEGLSLNKEFDELVFLGD